MSDVDSRVAAADLALAGFAPRALTQAIALVSTEGAIRLEADTFPMAWTITPRAGVTYRVTLLWVVEGAEAGTWWGQCDCANGQALGAQGRCYHKAAVLAVLSNPNTYDESGNVTWG